MTIPMKRLRAILDRINAATDGPWVSVIEGRDHQSVSTFVRTAGSDVELSRAASADLHFIAAARQDVPELVRGIARLNGWILARVEPNRHARRVAATSDNVNNSVDKKERRKRLEKDEKLCSRCPPHDVENRGRRTRSDKHKSRDKARS